MSLDEIKTLTLNFPLQIFFFLSALCFLAKRRHQCFYKDSDWLIYFIGTGFFFWPRLAGYGILVPQTGIKPAAPAVEAQSLNHWTTRELPVDTIES